MNAYGDANTGTPPQQDDTRPLSDNELRVLAQGKAAYTMLVILSTVAFWCGFYSVAYCDFVGREVTYKPGFNITSACSELMGQSTYENWCETLLEEHGVGFYAWMGTVPVDQQVCISYTLYNPVVNGYITPEFDTKFNSALALAVTANVFGSLGFFTFLFNACCPLTQERVQNMASYFMLACLFQGLSLLIFRSNICQVGFFDQYFPNIDNFNDFVESVECVQGKGSKLAITACVLYFFCMQLAVKAIAPLPFGYTSASAEEQQGWNQAWNRNTGDYQSNDAMEQPYNGPDTKSEHDEA